MIEVFVDASKTGVGLYCPTLHYKEAKKISCSVTTNEAEWLALINALHFFISNIMFNALTDNKGLWIIEDFNTDGFIIYSDSELVVKQINGQYRVKKEHLKWYYNTASRDLQELPCKIEIKHIPRKYNTIADELSQKYRK